VGVFPVWGEWWGNGAWHPRARVCFAPPPPPPCVPVSPFSSLSPSLSLFSISPHVQDPQCIYFALEYVPGGELFRHLRTRGRLPEAAARFYAAEVVSALAALHAGGVVYRDLKPENLLLDAGGHLKVADFGFAKALPRGGRTYTLCGTPDYLAPEVILNKGHGPSADWWAAGVLVYEMLAGAPPFVEADVGATYRRAVEGRFAVPPHFSAAARDLVRRLLQVDLSQRLGCLAGGVGDIKVERVGGWEGGRKKKKKKKKKK